VEANYSSNQGCINDALPRLFPMPAGQHTLYFSAREGSEGGNNFAAVARVLITTDPTEQPTLESEPPPPCN
jgi:hypothetical protein